MMSETMYDFGQILYKFRNSLQKTPLDAPDRQSPSHMCFKTMFSGTSVQLVQSYTLISLTDKRPYNYT